jgi:hypothetical protein
VYDEKYKDENLKNEKLKLDSNRSIDCINEPYGSRDTGPE